MKIYSFFTFPNVILKTNGYLTVVVSYGGKHR